MNIDQRDFAPLSKRGKTMSLEHLHPSLDSPVRLTSIISATFNLVSTVIGGGVLSLPFAYATSGLLLTSAMVLVAAIMATFSLYILCSCARRTGACSYAEVVAASFGRNAEAVVTLTLFVFLMFVVVAFMVLMRDINSSLVRLFLGVDENDSTTGATTTVNESVVLLVSVICCLPFMLQKNLHALRYNCYVGFFSVVILLYALIQRAVTTNITSPPFPLKPWERFHDDVLWSTSSWKDALFSFPLVALAFLSQFNMLSVHSSLINPTRPRLLKVIYGSIGTCTILFLLFGTAGYLFAYGATRDNILLNFPPTDKVILTGRVGLAVTLMCGISMILLPCRDSALLLPRQLKRIWKSSESSRRRKANRNKDRQDGGTREERKPLFADREAGGGGGADRSNNSSSSNNNNSNDDDSDDSYLNGGRPAGAAAASNSSNSNNNRDSEDSTDDEADPARRRQLDSSASTSTSSSDESDVPSPVVHVAVTLAMVVSCYFFATAVPGVSTVWSICGSSLGFVVAYILPSACYLKIRSRRKGHFNVRILGAWLMLFFSIAGCAACSYQAALRIITEGRVSSTTASDLSKDYDDDDAEKTGAGQDAAEVNNNNHFL